MLKHALTLTFLGFINILPISTQATEDLSHIRYGTEKVEGVDIFYREAGDPSKQALVLLHGFPASSHQYRAILAELGDAFYLFAPDYPGYGDSSAPSTTHYHYTFNTIAQTMEKLLKQRQIKNYVLMIHDFGAPIGFRIALRNPKDIAGFVVMNGNAYEAGLSDLVQKALAVDRTAESDAATKQQMFGYESLKWQYTHGTRNPAGINPDNWNLDHMKMSRPGTKELNLEMLSDYKSNVALYPKWQQYLRDTQPPMLIVWGKNDAFFTEAGAAAYQRDVKNIDYNILDTGHFPLEEDAPFIIAKIRNFMEALIK